MQAHAESSERLVCAILAAQVAALRDRIDDGVTVDLLWRTTDMLARLSGLLVAQTQLVVGGNSAFEAACAAAVATEGEISRSLDLLAFTQAQNQDRDRQVAQCVVTALERLAQTDACEGARMSPDELAALYVTEDQRSLHNVVTCRFSTGSVRDAAVQCGEIDYQKEPRL